MVMITIDHTMSPVGKLVYGTTYFLTFSTMMSDAPLIPQGSTYRDAGGGEAAVAYKQSE